MRGDEEVVDEVLVAGLHPHPAPAPPALGAVGGDAGALDVARVGDGDRHVLVGDHVLHRDLVHRVDDLGAAGIGVVFPDLLELLLDDLVDALRLAQDVPQLRDQGLHFLEVVHDLLPLQAGEALELHVEDGVGLDQAQPETLDEAGARLRRGLARADELDHLVQVVEGDDQAFEDVGPRLGLLEVVDRPPAHHFAPEGQEVLAGLEDVQDLGALIDDGQEDDAEGVLQGGQLVEVVQDDLAGLALLDVEDDAHAVPRALVADVGDAFHPLVLHELGDLLDELGLVELVGDLADDDRFLVTLADLDLGPGPHHDGAAAGAVGLPDPRLAGDEARGGEVGAGDALDEPLQALVRGEVLVVEQEVQGVHHLAQVVGRDVGGHAHRDPGGPVDEQVGQHGGEDGGLDQPVVVVGLEIDGLPVDVLHGGGAEPGEARLGVAHGRRRVPVHGAEVALPVHQGAAQVEVLGHAHQGVVDGGVAVGMVLAHDVAHDARALPVAATGVQAHLVHGEEHATVGGLQAVAHIGQGAPDDHGHGVVHVGLAHLVRDVGGDLVGGDGVVGCFGH